MASPNLLVSCIELVVGVDEAVIHFHLRADVGVALIAAPNENECPYRWLGLPLPLTISISKTCKSRE